MGYVFRAVRDADGERVALKVMKPRAAKDANQARRFMHEARACAEIRHRHLVGLIDFGQSEGGPYLAMRYVTGESLEQRIERGGPMEVDHVVRVAEQVGAGLDAMHAAGLVHRDVKVSNIVLDQGGDATLTDFGLAKGRDYSALTRIGQVVGTLDYLAPELIQGQSATALSDVYALGSVVYECLTGAPPFGGRGVYEVGLAILEDPPPDPRQHRRELSRALARAVLAALAKDPAVRPGSAGEYAGLLRSAAPPGPGA
jgi:serine/threonine protein kinase